jgi:hypothetical protein
VSVTGLAQPASAVIGISAGLPDEIVRVLSHGMNRMLNSCATRRTRQNRAM